MATTKKETSNDKPKAINGVTPRCEFIWPQIFEPSFKYKDEGEYSVKIKLETDSKECKKLIKEIDSVTEETMAFAVSECKTAKDKAKLKYANPAYEVETDDDNNETGFTIFRFKAPYQYKNKEGKTIKRTLAVFDSKGQALSGLTAWSGSEGKVSYQLWGYSTAALGVGCSCRMNAVQLLKPVSGGAKDAKGYGFGEDEDGFEASEAEGLATKTSDGSDDTTDELPFDDAEF